MKKRLPGEKYLNLTIFQHFWFVFFTILLFVLMMGLFIYYKIEDSKVRLLLYIFIVPLFGAITASNGFKRLKLYVNKLKEMETKEKEAKDRFISNFSHELRTPINSILNFTELLKKDKNLTPEQEKYLDIIHISTTHLSSLINNILDYSRLEIEGNITINNDSINLKKFINNIFEMLKPEVVNKNINFYYEIDDKISDYIIADKQKLQQILINLLHNAIKFTEKGEVKLIIKLIDNFLEFKVIDTGIGIPEDKKDLIFKKFVRINPDESKNYKGVGLGLPITKKLIELLGGDISFESTYKKGSTFTFKIPYKISHNIEQIKEGLDKTKIINKDRFYNKNILVFDDDEFIQILLSSMLKEFKLNLDVKDNGKIIYDIDIYKYDLVFTDINIPEVDGYQITKIIKEKRPDLPVIGLSANSGDEEINKALQSGMNDYIVKPFNKNNLEEILNKYL